MTDSREQMREPSIPKFTDWCDARMVAATVGSADLFVKEMVRAATARTYKKAAQIADDDLVGTPGVIAPWTERADGGHSAAAAQRIAAKIRLAATEEAKDV